MQLFAFFAPLAFFTIRASPNSICNVYYPPDLLPTTDKFAVMAAGLTGTGKSTLMDMLAGGYEMSKVGEESAYSETEEACALHFQYLGGKSAEVPNEQWEALDTPGFDDTGGQSHSITNAEVVQAALRKMKEVDAILLLWKYDEKFTDTNLGAFLALRSMFNAGIWKRVVIAYTHWAWEDCMMNFCYCKQQSDLLKVHEATMTAAFRYINEHTGDLRCNENVTSGCFPLAEDIPYVGSDLTLSKLQLMRAHGCDPLVKPTSCPPSQCDTSAADDIRKIRGILNNFTAAAEYRRLDTSQVTNYWVACEGAQTKLRLMMQDCLSNATCPGTIATDVAARLKTCIDGGITSEIQEIATLMDGRVDLQVHVAFYMNNTEYIAAPIFTDDVASLVAAYPDYQTYIACKIATDLSNQDVAVLIDSVTLCWAKLSFSPGFDSAIDALVTAHKKRRYSLRMAISFNMMQCQTTDSSCPSAAFARKVISTDESEKLSMWLTFTSEGRCCVLEGGTWAARIGSCDDSHILWNQTNINCLQHCDINDLTVPLCQVLSDGVVLCPLKGARGETNNVRGAFTAADGKVADKFVANGQSVSLSFNLADEVAFVMSSSNTQALCSEGAWRFPGQPKLPSPRQIRSCSVCQSSLECLSKSCIPGKGLENHLWLAGDSQHAELCSDPSVCGNQQDAHCAEPSCPTGYQVKDCSTTSCGSKDCCDKLGTCDDLCVCPLKPQKSQPKYCKGPNCTTAECCTEDPTVTGCSPATGGTCKYFGCDKSRGNTICVEQQCVCKSGQCARNYGYKTGHCEDQCSNPSDCGPDTGSGCNALGALFGGNSCPSWRGDTKCSGGICVCKSGCAVKYGQMGYCNSDGSGQLAAQSPNQGSDPQFWTAVIASFSAGLLAIFLFLLLAVRFRIFRVGTQFTDPLIEGRTF